MCIRDREHSVAATYADQCGLNKNKVMAWMQDTAQAQIETIFSVPNGMDPYGDRGPQTPLAVLKQFCNNLNEESQDFDDVVGRREVLRDLVQTVARRKKSNCVLTGGSV